MRKTLLSTPQWPQWIFMISWLLSSTQGWAGNPSPSSEPPYCSPSIFFKKEISIVQDNSQLKRAHGFKLGQVRILGLAVGKTRVDALIDLTKLFNPGKDMKKANYCTWYLHYPSENPLYTTHSKQASETFNFKPILVNPKDLSREEAVVEFLSILKSSFDEDSPSFLSCAKDHHFIALGCQGMKHRGPTGFGALLAFSGCTAENSMAIVNQLWGLNGVKADVQLAVIQAFYRLGETRPESRKQLADLFSTQ